MVSVLKNKNVARIIDIVALLLCLAVALIVCANKCGMHEDEYYSFYSSNRTDGLWLTETVNKQSFLNELEVLEGEGFNFGLVKEVQSWDVHPPLYYFVLHFVCSLSWGKFSMWQGLIINLVCFVLALVLMKCLGTKLVKICVNRKDDECKSACIEDYVITFVCLCFGLSSAALTAVVFIRMYMLLTVFVLLITLLHVYGYELISREEKELSLSFYIFLGIITFLGFMTHYYFFIWIFFLAAGFNIWDFIRREKKKLIGLIRYGITEIITVIVAYLFYPAWPAQMFKGQRGAQATGNFFDISNTWERICFFAEKVNRIGFGKMGFLLFFILILSIVFSCVVKKQKPKAFSLCIIISAALLLYFLTISKTALMLGDSSIRYQMPVLAIAYLIVAIFIMQSIETCSSDDKKLNIIIYSLCFICGVLLLISNIKGDIDGNISFLFPQEKENMAQIKEHENAKAIYLYQESQEWCVWAQAAEIMEYDEVCFINSSSIEDYSRDTEELKNDEIILFVDSGVDYAYAINGLSNKFAVPLKFEKLYDNTYCSVYLGNLERD